MNFKKMPELMIGDLEIKVPIIQGGMGVGVSLSGLAAAVAEEGGIGVISAAGIGILDDSLEADYKEAHKRALKKEIEKARAVTQGIIGVNILVALSNYDELLEAAIEGGADLVFLGAGLPLKVPEIWSSGEWEKIKTRIIPIVSSSRAARIIFQSWQKHYNCVPDAVVVEGPLAGGHLGYTREQINSPDFALEKTLPEVIAVLKPFEQRFGKIIPVIAAGGVYTGADIDKYFKLGAKGVQLGTRFVATFECDASKEFKEAYIKCGKEDLVIINSPVGLPGRAIRSSFLKKIESGARMPFKCPWKCLRTCDKKTAPYCIAQALANAKNGHIEDGFAFAGANAYRIDRIMSVKELFQTLIREFEQAAAISG